MQLREPRGGWRPAVADTTLPFDGYVRHLPWKPASWETSFSYSNSYSTQSIPSQGPAPHGGSKYGCCCSLWCAPSPPTHTPIPICRSTTLARIAPREAESAVAQGQFHILSLSHPSPAGHPQKNFQPRCPRGNNSPNMLSPLSLARCSSLSCAEFPR